MNYEYLKKYLEPFTFLIFRNFFTHKFELIQVGVGLVVLQQLGGSNAIAYYSGSIFTDAAKSKKTRE